MTSSAAPPLTDTAFADLIEELTARFQTGEPIDTDAILRDHPEYTDRLNDLLPALKLLANLSRSVSNGAVNVPLATDEPLEGTLGDFRLIREVGRGGMGIVYEAEQISLNRRVALKVLPFAATMDPRQLQRFRNEAQAAACLHHPNIVPVHGVGVERGVHYYAMQLIEGQTLAEVIKNLTPRPPSRNGKGEEEPSPPSPLPQSQERGEIPLLPSPPASGGEGMGVRGVASTAPNALLSTKRDKTHFRHIAALIADAADALEYAHSMGVVHRDIKPGNLMLDSCSPLPASGRGAGGEGHLWITDFGLAKLANPATEIASPSRKGGELTLTGDMIGTLRYMSPEAALAKHGLVDHRTDIYSLGATLYELLTLKPAIDGDDKGEILKSIAWDDPTPLRKLDKSIPPELETITLKCLAKEPGERYSSAKDLANDLRHWLDHKPIKAKPPGWNEMAVQWRRRHATLVGAAMAVLAVSAVAFGIASILIWKKGKDLQQAYESENRQRRIADERLSIAQAAVNDMYIDVAQRWLDDEPQMEPLQQRFLEKSIEYYERFCNEQSSDINVLRYQAAALGHLALLYGKTDQTAQAEAAHERAMALADQVTRAGGGDFAHRLLSATISDEYAWFLFVQLKRAPQAETRLKSSSIAWRDLIAESSTDRACRLGLMENLVRFAQTSGLGPSSENALTEAVEIGARLVQSDVDGQSRAKLANALQCLARLRLAQRNFDGARQMLETAIEHRRAGIAANPRSRSASAMLAAHHDSLADVYSQAGESEREEASRRESVRIRARLMEDFPLIVDYQRQCAEAQSRLAFRVMSSLRADEAYALIAESRRIAHECVRRAPSRSNRTTLARILTAEGTWRSRSGQFDDATSLLRQATTEWREITTGLPTNDQAMIDFADTLGALGGSLTMRKQFRDAVAALNEAVDVRGRACDQMGPSNVEQAQRLALDQKRLAVLKGMSPSSLGDVFRAARTVTSVALGPDTQNGQIERLRQFYLLGEYNLVIFQGLDGMFPPLRGAPRIEGLFLASMAFQQKGDLSYPFLIFVSAEREMEALSSAPDEQRRLRQIRDDAARLIGVNCH